MYSRQEAAQRKQEFWTAFGQYMAPVLSAEGEKINWVNYKTGEKNIRFRMQANNKEGRISIDMTHKDAGIQQLYFEQFGELRGIFNIIVGPAWQWQLHTTDDSGRTVSTIFLEKKAVSIFRKEDWPALISFFKDGIIALDEFWNQVKYSFELLR